MTVIKDLKHRNIIIIGISVIIFLILVIISLITSTIPRSHLVNSVCFDADDGGMSVLNIEKEYFVIYRENMSDDFGYEKELGRIKFDGDAVVKQWRDVNSTVCILDWW